MTLAVLGREPEPARRRLRVMRFALVCGLVLIAAACGGRDGPTAVEGPATGLPVTTSPPVSSPSGQLLAGEALSGSAGAERAAVAADAPVAELVAGWNDAGFALLREQPAADNVVFSPASIGHALLMASAAGDESTQAAIEAAFGLPDGPTKHGTQST